MGYFEGLLILTGINMIVGLGLYWTVQTGQVSVGHAAFMALGAYLSGILTVKLGWTLPLGILAGALCTGVIGTAVGAVALRFRGLYLSIATLGFGEIVRVFFLNNEYFGAASGLGGMTGVTGTAVAVATVLLLLVTWFVSRSRLGLAFRALRMDEEAASLTGLPTTSLKVQAFGIGALITGLGGALYAHYMFFIDSAEFGFERSILILMMVVFGGIETLWGTVVGAAVFTVLPEALRYVGLEKWRMVAYAALICGLMLVRPQGLVDMNLLRRLSAAYRARELPPAKGPGGKSV
jgi:branched-chain amino acid transport system permease protein